MSDQAIVIRDDLDITWYAVDKLGCVAQLRTGGFGPLPAKLEPEIHRFDLFERETASTLPDLSQALIDDHWKSYVVLTNKKNADQLYLKSAISTAIKGFYVFDAILDFPIPSNYFRLTRPTSPIKLNTLSINDQALLGACRFSAMSFEESLHITVSDIISSN